jgi:DNA-binding transcriptional LysR family regulator
MGSNGTKSRNLTIRMKAIYLVEIISLFRQKTMQTPSFKQLEAFWWAATSVNFVTAAQQVHLSVSSLSKRIAELESGLGKQLFDRSGHKAVLTDAGRQLLPTALEVLDAMAALQRSIGDAESLSGHCRIGVGDLSAMTWLPSFVRAVKTAHPDLGLEVAVDVGGVLERRLAEGELDFAVIAGRSVLGNIRSHPVGAAHFAWVAAQPLVASAKLPVPELLKHHALITLPRNAGTTRLLDDWLLEHAAAVSSCIACNSWAAVAGMLCEGVGVGFLPTGWADSLKLVEVGTRSPLRPLRYAFQWRHGDTRALIPAMRRLVEEKVDFSRALVANQVNNRNPSLTRR